MSRQEEAIEISDDDDSDSEIEFVKTDFLVWDLTLDSDDNQPPPVSSSNVNLEHFLF